MTIGCLRIGCTGWSIPAALAPRFSRPGSHLERYARTLSAVEIASSFYRLLAEFEVARVAADPARVAAAAEPGGWRGLAYLRLHGSPVVYRSTYTAAFLNGVRARSCR